MTDPRQKNTELWRVEISVLVEAPFGTTQQEVESMVEDPLNKMEQVIEIESNAECQED